MTYRNHTIRGEEFCISTFEEDEKQKIAYDLVKNLLVEVSCLCKKYDNSYFYDLPYHHNERGMDCVVLPALSKICNGLVMTEAPVRRKTTESEVSGRLDYWCMYKGYSFCIELKFCKDAYTSPHLRKEGAELWKYMVKNQLKNSKQGFKEFCQETSNGIYYLGLQFVASRKNVLPTDNLVDAYRKGLKNKMDKRARDLSESKTLAPNFAGTWLIPKRIVFHNQKAIYPGLMLFAKYQLIKSN